MDFQDDAAEFSVEDVDTIVKNAITGCLTDVMYNPKKVSSWSPLQGSTVVVALS